MEKICLRAYAKLNLLLNVQGKMFNGYHSLETIMTPVDICDTIKVKIIEDSKEIIISTNSSEIPVDENNILYKCVAMFQNHFNLNKGFKIYLEKNIPVGAGLGGESADAATMMYFINNYFDLKLKYTEIFYYGRLLGWDVPICYFRKPIYINDLHSICEFVECKTQFYFLLVKPNFKVFTTQAFIDIDKINVNNKDSSLLLDAFMHEGKNIGKLLNNPFIFCDQRLVNEFYKLLEISKLFNFDGVSMTGTGSCFFLVCRDFVTAQKGYNMLKNLYPYVSITKNINGRKTND